MVSHSHARSRHRRAPIHSVLTRVGDVEAHDPEANGHQTGAGEVFDVLVQAQAETITPLGDLTDFAELAG